MHKNQIKASGLFIILAVIICFIFTNQARASKPAKITTFGEILCQKDGFHCQIISEKSEQILKKTNHGEKIITINSPQTWEELWPSTAEREIVMKINRLNIKLKKDMVIAVPNDLTNKTLQNFAPFEKQIDPPLEKLLIYDPALLAWAIYNSEGTLLRWGPGICGKPSKKTRVGEFKIIRISGPKCRSGKYNAPMPWAMFFHPNGYAFHGSPNLPGYPASHGCVRLFNEDAEWLNKNFVKLKTKVIIKPYPD